jgi:hypothetical protein
MKECDPLYLIAYMHEGGMISAVAFAQSMFPVIKTEDYMTPSRQINALQIAVLTPLTIDSNVSSSRTMDKKGTLPYCAKRKGNVPLLQLPRPDERAFVPMANSKIKDMIQ